MDRRDFCKIAVAATVSPFAASGAPSDEDRLELLRTRYAELRQRKEREFYERLYESLEVEPTHE